MNLVELRLVEDICCRWTQIGVMAVDMWYMETMTMMVVYGSSDDDDAMVIYGSDDVTTYEQNSKL